MHVYAINPDTSKIDTIKTEIQDLSISFFNNFRLNPALTGINSGPSLVLEAGIDKPLKTHGQFNQPQLYSFLFDVAIGERRNFAFGIYVNEAKGGAIVNPSTGLAVSGTFDLSGSNSFYHKLRIGASIEYDQIGFSYEGITSGDMIDPMYGFIYSTNETKPGDLNKQYINLSSGLWYHNTLLYCGFAVHNITQPNISIYSVSIIPREFIISSGGNIKISKKFSLHPSFNISIIDRFKGKLNSYTPAIICSYHKKYNAGFSYMDLNKIGIHAGCILAKHLTLIATCAFSTNADLYQFGTLSYLGGKIQYHFKK